MKKLFFYMVAAAIALTSCSSEDVVEVNNNGNAIDFRVAMGPGATSRGVETTKDNIPYIYVTAILDEGKGGNYFTDALYKSLSGGYKCVDNGVEQYYWPYDEVINFYAYSYGLTTEEMKNVASAKLNTSLFGTVSITNAGQTFTGFTPQSEIKDQVDFVTAQAQGSRAANLTTPVKLQFNHALSQIRVRARNEHPFYNYEVYGVKIANVKPTGTFDMAAGTWSFSDGLTSTSYKVKYSTPVDINGTEEEELNGFDIMGVNGDGHAMLIPQELSPCTVTNNVADKTSGSYLAVLIRVTSADTGVQVYPKASATDTEVIGEGDNAIKCGWAIIPIDTEWLPGTRYVYILDFSDGAGYDEETGQLIFKGAVTFTCEVSGWEDAEDQSDLFKEMP